MTDTRRYDLDWLRLIAIIILLFYHTGMWFNTWGWHVKNNDLSRSFEFWMVWLHPWRMPLLLFISGAGTYMALGKRTSKQFVKERFRRLFIPLLFGMFVVVPPQIYFEYIDKYPNYWEFYKTVFEFRPYPGGSFSWHHLWFVLYLLVYSLLLLPFLKFIRSERSIAFKESAQKWMSSALGMLLIPSTFIFFTQGILRPFFPDEKHNLTDVAFIVFYGCFFFFGVVFYSNQALWQAAEKNRYKLLIASALILIPFYTVFFHWHKFLSLPFNDTTLDLIFDISSIYLSWFTLITVIGFGQHYLNKPNPILPYTNEGLYPFYILHQTVIIWIGWYICKLDWSIASKFWSISLLTFITCTAFFFLVIKPFNFMRLFFGLKQKAVLMFAFVFLLSCSPTEKRVHQKSEIDAAMREYDRLLQAMDVEGIAALYDEEGELGNMVKGRDSIRIFLKEFSNLDVISQVSSTDDIQMLGDSAVQTGSYVQIDVVEKKDTVVVRGKYNVLWRWDGTAWKILRIETTPM